MDGGLLRADGQALQGFGAGGLDVVGGNVAVAGLGPAHGVEAQTLQNGVKLLAKVAVEGLHGRFAALEYEGQVHHHEAGIEARQHGRGRGVALHVAEDDALGLLPVAAQRGVDIHADIESAVGDTLQLLLKHVECLGNGVVRCDGVAYAEHDGFLRSVGLVVRHFGEDADVGQNGDNKDQGNDAFCFAAHVFSSVPHILWFSLCAISSGKARCTQVIGGTQLSMDTMAS